MGAGGISVLNGGFAIFSRDIYRDLTGFRECGRWLYPDLIKKQNQRTKRTLAICYVASALAMVGGIVELTPPVKNRDAIDAYIIQSEESQNNLEEILIKEDKP